MVKSGGDNVNVQIDETIKKWKSRLIVVGILRVKRWA